MVQFHCYDIIDEGLPFDQRIEFVTESLMLLGDSIHTVNTDWIDSEIEAKVRHQTNLNHGYEGSIVRTNDVYKCGRSWNLRKFKDFSDAEATIVDWVEGKGKRKGTIGKFVAVDDEGNEFGMPVMDDYKIMEKMYDIADWYIGKTATFTYFQRTPAGSYRHPLYKCVRNYE